VYFTRYVTQAKIRDIGTFLRESQFIVFLRLGALRSQLSATAEQALELRMEMLSSPVVDCDKTEAKWGAIREVFEHLGRLIEGLEDDRPFFVAFESEHLRDPGAPLIPCRIAYVEQVYERDTAILDVDEACLAAFGEIYAWILSTERQASKNASRQAIVDLLDLLIMRVNPAAGEIGVNESSGSQGISPPDLLLQVHLTSAPGGASLTYVLHSTAAGFHFETIPGPVLKKDPEAFAASLFEQIERLHQGYDVDGGLLLEEEAEQELVSLGQSLYRELFPREMREAYRRFRGVHTVQITSDEPAIPWELIKPYDDEREPVIDDDFFCMRFQLTRWRNGRTPVSAFSVRKLACVGSDELPNAAEERDLLTTLAASHPGIENASPRAARYKEVEKLLEKGGCDLLHFIGHGDFSPERANEAKIVLEDRPFRARNLTGGIQTRLKKDRPLVFLNACRVGRQAWSLTGFGGWVEAWVRTCECGAFLGPQWAVSDSQAYELAKVFYHELEHGRTLGEAVLEARHEVRKNDPGQPTWLAFAVYGHPNARVSFGESVQQEIARSETREEVRAPSSAVWTGPYMPEGPPADFVERPELIEPVITALVDRDAISTVGLAAAFRGAGGYGKTTLARAVCHDPRIRRVFPDGILWVTLGERPENLIGSVEDLIYTLSRERPGFSSLDAAAAALADLLEPLRALIVIDDVWSATHLRPFLRGGPRCARLVTTRDRTVLPAAASVVQVDAMQNEEALRLLAGGLPVEQRPALERLAGRLGHWPLLLRLVNGVLRDRCGHGQNLAGALLAVGAALDRHGLTAFDVADPEDRNRAVASTLAVSLDQLRPEARELFLDLAIFPEDVDAPFSALEKLWEDLAPIDVEALCIRLHQLSLLSKADLIQRCIRLHDVIRAFLHRQRLPELPAVHRRFLAAGRRGIAGVWRDLPPEETYLWRYLSYHLEAAGFAEELATTVQDLAFLVARVAFGDPHGAEGDIVRAERLDPDNRTLRALHAAFANAKHLLIPCQSLTEIVATFLSRLTAVSELRDLVAAAAKCLPSPRLRARFPFPDSSDPALLRTLASFGGQVNACCISADGSWLVTACSDGSVTLWDILLGSEVWAVQEPADVPVDGGDLPVRDSYAALSADGSTLLAADAEGTVRVWDIVTRVELCCLDVGGRVVSAALSFDGRWGVCRSKSGMLRAFETPSGRIVLDAAVNSSPQGGCSLSAEGRLLLATLDKKLCLWDLKEAKLLRTWPAHDHYSTCCALSSDGTRTLSASDDGMALFFDAATGSELQRFKHGSEIYGCALSVHGDLAVTVGDEGAMLWDIDTGAKLRSLVGHVGCGFSCAVNADGRLVATGGGDQTVKLWRDPLIERGSAPPFLANLRRGATDASGNLLAAVVDDAALEIWDLRTGEQISCIQHPSAVMGCVLTPGADLAISVASDGGARIWDLKTGECAVLLEKGPPLTGCALSPRGDRFVAAEDGGNGYYIRVWDVRQRKEIRCLLHGPSMRNRCRFSADGRFLLLASRECTVRMWDLSLNSGPQVVARHEDDVDGCAISTDGQLIASASRDRTVRLWDLAGKPLLVLEDTHPVLDCAFQPGGKLLVSLSSDIGVGSTLKVWDTETGLPIAGLRVDRELETCEWLPRGDVLFATGRFGSYLLDWQP
jgi:WD40 repeat protein